MKRKTRIVALPLEESSLSVIFRAKMAMANSRSLLEHTARHVGNDAALFHAFADAVPTAEGVADFRNEFLIADDEMTVIDTDSWATVMEPHAISRADLGRKWEEEILAMRRCIEIWDLIRNEDTAKLNRFIKWEIDPTRGLSVIYDSHPDLDARKPAPPPEKRTREVIASDSGNPLLMRRLSAGDTIDPAKLYLERIINDRLETGVQPRMFATFRSSARPATTKNLSLNFVPKHFVAALWLQLAEAIDRDKRYERCRCCKSWFELSCRGTHKDRQYCSDACKVNFHRKRKEVKRLIANGVKLRKIAERTGLEMETVKEIADL